MSRSQRLTFLGIAAAIAAIAVVVLVVSGGKGNDEQAVPSGSGQASAPLLTAGGEQTISVTQGDAVTLRVKADTDEVVHIHGYNIEKPVPAGTTITISFKATINGIFEIEFHHSGATIGRLKVAPR
jgi:FtsP/CotA-like multicopper oxidase with cupredoxin domain